MSPGSSSSSGAAVSGSTRGVGAGSGGANSGGGRGRASDSRERPRSSSEGGLCEGKTPPSSGGPHSRGGAGPSPPRAMAGGEPRTAPIPRGDDDDCNDSNFLVFTGNLFLPNFTAPSAWSLQRVVERRSMRWREGERGRVCRVSAVQSSEQRDKEKKKKMMTSRGSLFSFFLSPLFSFLSFSEPALSLSSNKRRMFWFGKVSQSRALSLSLSLSLMRL